MATAENEERRVLTILWRVENLRLLEKYNYSTDIGSPLFRVHTLKGAHFYLYLGPKSWNANDKHLSIFLCLLNVPLDFPIDCEWSFIGSNGSPLVSATSRNHNMIIEIPFFMPDCPTYEEVFVTRKSDFISHDALTVRLRIWKSDGNLLDDEFISCRTRLHAMNYFFLWPIPGFSAVPLKQKMTTPVKFGDTLRSDNFILKFSLDGQSLADASLNVELASDSISNSMLVTVKISVLDIGRNEISNTKIEGKFLLQGKKEILGFPKLMPRKELMRKKADCLRNDILTLRCEMSTILFTNIIDKHYHGFSKLDVHITKDSSALLDESCRTTEQSVEPPDISLQERNTLILLREDLLSLYKEQNLTDFELHSGDVSFPVHKIILSARSPVFKAMFSSGMKESDSNSQNVPDLDVHTLNRMLTFLYGGTVEPDLHLEGAAKLYYAADKYQVGSLKEQCSSILRSSISVSNVSDILTLADRHQDRELLSFVHEFFCKNFDEIMRSEVWGKFLLRDSLLAGKTVHEVYKKKLDA